MKAVQDSVAAYLQACTGVRTVADRTRARGEYPLLAVSVREDGTVLVDGGRQAEHTYRVTVRRIRPGAGRQHRPAFLPDAGSAPGRSHGGADAAPLGTENRG